MYPTCWIKICNMFFRLSLVCLLWSLVAAAVIELTEEERKRRREQRRRRRFQRICPRNKPRHGMRCPFQASWPACEYEFVDVPVSRDNGTCSGNLSCTPMSECDCVDRKWKCKELEITVCEGEMPEGAMEPCREDDGDGGTTGPPTQSPTANIFQHENCPQTSPGFGSACSRSLDLPECVYEFIALPVYEDNGACLGELICVPSRWCECFFGEWQCSRLTVRNCNGSHPDGAFRSCTPSGVRA